MEHLSLPHDPKKHLWGQTWKQCSSVSLIWEGLCTQNLLLQVKSSTNFFYLEVLRRLSQDLQNKHYELWQTGDWFFYHDNVPAHTMLSIQQVLTKKMAWLQYPTPSFTWSCPKWLFLFLEMKKSLKENVLPMWKRYIPKMANSLKGTKINKLKNCFE